MNGAERSSGVAAGEVAALGQVDEPQSATPPGGRQRRLPGGRRRVVQVRVSDDELARLQVLAEGAGVSVPRYLAETGLSPGGPAPAERRAWFAALLAARRQLAGAANNLNQLTRWSHDHQTLSPGADRAAGAVAAAAQRLTALLDEDPVA